MRIIYICLTLFLLVGINTISSSTDQIKEESFSPSVKINIIPYSVVYEGDIINCDITGKTDIIYWSINNQSKHYYFYNDDPIIFNPESTPLTDTYVNLTVYAENSQGKSTDTVPITLKKIFFGDIHFHTTFGDGRSDIDTMYQNAIDENYLDFAACSEHGSMKYPVEGSMFPIIKRIINNLVGNDPWEVIKNKTIEYYDPGNFTTLLGFEWSASNLFPGGYKISPNGHEDVSHINFYYRDVYEDAEKYSPLQKLNYDEIFEAMAAENDKGHLNIGFFHHPIGKIYIFRYVLYDNPILKNIPFLYNFEAYYTTNFSFLANNLKNTMACDEIMRGVEVYSGWGTAIGQYSNISITWPYYEDIPENTVVICNKTDAWVENGMWEWSESESINKKFVMQMGSDSHNNRPGGASLGGHNSAGIMAAYSVHNKREEIWDAMDNCDIYGSQLLKIRANVRFDDQMVLGSWINCTNPLTINISAMSTFPGLDGSGRDMCPDNYSADELDYPISDIWLIKKDSDRGRPWCKVIGHVQPNENLVVVSFEDDDVQPNDFYYVAIRQKGEELGPNQNDYTAFLGPVFIENVKNE